MEKKGKSLRSVRSLSLYVPDDFVDMGIIEEVERYGGKVERSANAVIIRILAKATNNGTKGSLDKFLKGA